jgi:hypothetical protein
VSAIRNGLHAHLVGDATLTAMLPAGAASIFADASRPADVALPAIQIQGDAEHTSPLDGDGFYRVQRPLHVLAEANGDQAQVDAIAERVRLLFEDPTLVLSLDIAGHAGWVGVDGPVELDPDKWSYGRGLVVTLNLWPA